MVKVRLGPECSLGLGGVSSQWGPPVMPHFIQGPQGSTLSKYTGTAGGSQDRQLLRTVNSTLCVETMNVPHSGVSLWKVT